MSVSLLPPTLSPNPSPVLSETASSFPEHLHDELLRQKVPDDGEVISGDKAKKYKKEDFDDEDKDLCPPCILSCLPEVSRTVCHGVLGIA